MYRSRPEEHKGIEHAILIAKAYIACILQSISVQAVEGNKLHGTDTVIILDTFPVCRLLVTLQCSLAAEKHGASSQTTISVGARMPHPDGLT